MQLSAKKNNLNAVKCSREYMASVWERCFLQRFLFWWSKSSYSLLCWSIFIQSLTINKTLQTKSCVFSSVISVTNQSVFHSSPALPLCYTPRVVCCLSLCCIIQRKNKQKPSPSSTSPSMIHLNTGSLGLSLHLPQGSIPPLQTLTGRDQTVGVDSLCVSSRVTFSGASLKLRRLFFIKKKRVMVNLTFLKITSWFN